MHNQAPRPRRRKTPACDYCKGRKIRCDGHSDRSCTKCRSTKRNCEFLKAAESKKRKEEQHRCRKAFESAQSSTINPEWRTNNLAQYLQQILSPASDLLRGSGSVEAGCPPPSNPPPGSWLETKPHSLPPNPPQDSQPVETPATLPPLELQDSRHMETNLPLLDHLKDLQPEALPDTHLYKDQQTNEPVLNYSSNWSNMQALQESQPPAFWNQNSGCLSWSNIGFSYYDETLLQPDSQASLQLPYRGGRN